MAIGFPASFETTQTYTGDLNTARDRTVKTLNSLGWKFEQLGSDVFACSASINLASWGEKMTISLGENSITVRSVCSMPFQIVDWGKNETNVMGFLRAFNSST